MFQITAREVQEVSIVSLAENKRSQVCACKNEIDAGEKNDQPGNGGLERAQNPSLYRKRKDVAIYLTEKKQLCVEVSMDDPRHRMSCTVTFSQPELIVQDVCGRMEKYPHPDCSKAESCLEVMIGKSVKPGVLQAEAKSMRDSSCTHLLDLFREACYSVLQGMGLYGRQVLKELHPELSDEQVSKIFFKLMPALLDSCVAYQSGNNFVKMLENVPFPMDKEKLKSFVSLLRSE